MIAYLVTVNGKVSQVAYKNLEDAQKFVQDRCNANDTEGQKPYYNVTSTSDYNRYIIEDVRIL